MDRSFALSRRGLIRSGLAAGTLAPLVGLANRVEAARPPAEGASDPWQGLKVGIATYTFSKLPLEAAIQAIRRVGVGYASIKDAHLSLKSNAEQRRAVAAKFKAAGITPLSCGVITLSDDEAEIRNAFEYARDAGLPTIVGKPTRKSLPVLDRMVKEFDIKFAIHNHGPEDKVWPSPYDAWEAIQPFDPRIGVCIDVGHTARAGVDPSEAIRKCSARLHDLHIKDIEAPSGRSRPVEVGRGILDVPGMLRALLEIKYAHHVGLEFEKDLNDPVPGSAESIGNIRGTLAGLRRP